MKFRVWHVRTLLQSQEFRSEYCFYICYISLLWFIIQIIILRTSIYDYIVVLGLQIFSLFISAIVFIGLKNHYQPSSYWTKLWYFVFANGPWLWLIYYWLRGMWWMELIIYVWLMLVMTVVEWCFYDRLFDHCCDWAYRLKMLYHTHKENKSKNWKI